MRRRIIGLCTLALVYQSTVHADLSDWFKDFGYGFTLPYRYLGNKTADFLDYTKSFLKNGFDATRSLNAGVSGIRDLSTFKSFITSGGRNYQREMEILNQPPTGASREWQRSFNEHCLTVASVDTTDDLCPEETDFVNRRLEHINARLPQVLGNQDQALQEVLKKAASKGRLPRIAACGSGGGFRAMMVQAGFIKGLERTGLIDCMLYISALSGSTWSTIPRSFGISTDVLAESYRRYAKVPITLQLKSYAEVVKNYPQLIPSKQPNDYSLYAGYNEFQNNIMRKFYWNQYIDSMDLYGAFLAQMVLSPFDDPVLLRMRNSTMLPVQTRQRVLFSQAGQILSKNPASFPLPIGTAVSPAQSWFDGPQRFTESRMYWFEFTPYRIGTSYYNKNEERVGAYVPTWAFGRKFVANREPQSWVQWLTLQNGDFKEAVSESAHPDQHASEYPLGNLLATWGSAFTPSPRDLLHVFGHDEFIGAKANSTAGVFQSILDLFFKVFTPVASSFKNFRLLPSTVWNFMGELPDSYQTERTLTLVDAGIDFNLPFPPLLRDARHIDVIIAMDGSSPTFDDKGRSSSLENAEKWAEAHKIAFPKIIGTEAYKNAAKQPYTIFPSRKVTYDGKEYTSPVVIHIPFSDNAISDATGWKPSDCRVDGDCDTFNFEYDVSSVNGIIEHVAQTVEKIVFEAIQKEVVALVQA